MRLKLFSPHFLVAFGIFAALIGLMGIVAFFLLSYARPISAENTAVGHVSSASIDLGRSKPSNVVTYPVSGQPERIAVPGLGINLAVIDGHYSKDGSWTLTPTNAQFATPSKLPNNSSGTTFIYGHDTNNVFHPLHQVRPDGEAIVATKNGYRFIYGFRDSVITTPFSIHEVTAASAKPRLSLMTCYGPTSADRHIFHFYLVRVERSNR